MIIFPVIERLSVADYALYPGEPAGVGLDIAFGGGPWLVLGVNGLGKSTLLLLMRYLLAGPVRLRDARFSGERDDLVGGLGRVFAVRVRNDARGATGCLQLRIGGASVMIERHLATLVLSKVTISSATKADVVLTEEAEYRSAIARLMGLDQFEDVVRVADYIQFVLEGSQDLLWDLAAQYEIFRALLLPSRSAELRALEAKIVSNDSAARNLNASLHGILQRRQNEVAKSLGAKAILTRLRTEQAALDDAVSREEGATGPLESAIEERDTARLNVKRAERDLQSATEVYEKIKFDTLRAAFGELGPSEQYVLLKLIAEGRCLACHQSAPDLAAELEARHRAGLCVVCGSVLPSNDEDHEEAPAHVISHAWAELTACRERVGEYHRTFADRAMLVDTLMSQVEQARNDVERHSRAIRRLRKELPSSDAATVEREENQIAALREQVQYLRSLRAEAESEIEQLLSDLRGETEKINSLLKARFDEVALPYFAESVRLVYAPRETRIGQQGQLFSIPAFEVDMTSGATEDDFVRRRADQVSLSQREYLDIIFRMVLMEVAGANTGTLIVDGPEGSVDAIFAERAGDLFAAFARRTGSNVILACNIVEGGFIPHSLAGYGGGAASRVVNLITQSVPTAALRDLRPEYEHKVSEILAKTPA